MRLFLTLFAAFLFVFSSSIVQAQDTEETAQESVQAEASDFEQRLALSREMHTLKSVKEQVDSAVNGVAERLPQSQRETFKANMRNVLNYRAIENISVNAMAETFTLQELEAMVEYNKKPEAKSANEKLPDYQNKIGPEIVRMIDKAIMRVRTGTEQ